MSSSDRPAPSHPYWPRSVPDSHESGELPSPYAARAAREFDHIRELRSKELDQVERQVQLVAPHALRKIEMTQDQIAKRRAVAALEDGCYHADSQRRFAKLAGLNEKSIREWIEIPQRSVPFHLVFRIPDDLSFVMVSHVVRRWGRRSLLAMRALCEELLGESEDGPARRAM